MSGVVVIGGGLAGLASAVRLARLGHDVTLLERSQRLGGALSPVEADGFVWDAGPATTLLPAVLRDLFRKTGRPLERELDLVPLEVVREHRFADGTALRLPGGTRSGQRAAVEALGAGLGQRWIEHVESYAEVWDRLRRDRLERVWDPELAPRETVRMLGSRESLRRRLRRTLPDERLRLVAAHPLVADGHDPRDVPWWAGMGVHLEERFGAWTVPGGLHAVSSVLAGRLGTRGVTVRCGVEARDLVVRSGRVVAVATDEGEIDAEVVVCAVDPRRLPALAAHVTRTTPAMPPVIVHLGLEGEPGAGLPPLDAETVLHGDPLLVVRPGTSHAGRTAWTVLARGRIAEDPVLALARAGIDVRPSLRTRVDLSPRAQVEQWGGSPLGVRWQGRATLGRQLGPRTPLPGVLVAGAHAPSGAGVPFVGLSAALVAQIVGPAA